ncbi:hypothetical protein J6590_094398 [Homalodisca vitripennis]|nr:hypothetical protein J6590_094398 [Homalodisca vitripennis]
MFGLFLFLCGYGFADEGEALDILHAVITFDRCHRQIKVGPAFCRPYLVDATEGVPWTCPNHVARPSAVSSEVVLCSL